MKKFLEKGKGYESDSSTTDEGTKRKMREGDNENEEREEHAKSRKLSTNSPQKKYESKLDTIIEMMSKLSNDVTEIKKDQKSSKEAIEQLIEDNRKLKNENKHLKQENKEIKEELKEIKENMEFMEKQRRKNNVVMNGLTIDTYEQGAIKEAMLNLFKGHMEIEVKIKNAYKLGTKTCLIELEDQEDKIKVMKNKSKLKNYKEEKIYINNDTTMREREIQKTIRMIAREERDKGNEVKIGTNKLWVNNEEWKWNNKEDKIEKSKN
uniref:Uncharacterized protein PF11_0207-like isoform X1 n=1 Tax=Diabrotica virgifera virgifera TaxID=50390 RepID=A0A6P7FC70_DIAVI